MTRILTFLAFVTPASAFAHGGHAPLPDGAHELSHAAPLLGVAIIALAGGLALYQRWSS